MLDELLEVLDIRALVIAIVLSLLFLGMIWGLQDIWGDYSIRNKIGISILLPPMAYFIVLYSINKD